jgi:ferric-dicitrate binding protein FerR (iron transport regulator)
VWLNAGAKAEFPKFFNFRRHVELQGEAYFEVSKGGTFTVSTNGGEVTVLGTRFNVAQGGHFFEVACFEGRVRVTARGREKILRPDRGIRFVGDSVEELGDFPQTPSWRGNESSFRSAPLGWVAQSLGQRYGVEIQCPASLQNVRFTGSFPHDDLDKALRTVCTPLQAGYKKMPGNKILIRR